MKIVPSLCLGTLLAAASPTGAATLSAPATFYGMCDASAAVALNTNFFIVANDEDNVLRVYKRQGSGMPVFAYDVSSFLRLSGKSREADIEGAARIGDLIYWIGSHGRNAIGKNSPNRQRFFATKVTLAGDTPDIKPVGKPYAALLRDFMRESRLSAFNLAAAARLAPKASGGLNIEGLTAKPDGSLLLGFRNPIPLGRALLVPLLNPAQLIEGLPAKFGDPVLLDLGGLGVRSLGYSKGRYLIIAGPYDNEGESRLYEWSGGNDSPQRIEGIRFHGLNPEGLSFPDVDGREQFFFVSDDGTLKIEGVDCKRLKDPAKRRFRGYLLER